MRSHARPSHTSRPRSARDAAGYDADAANELELYTDNDSKLYREKDAYLANMYRKMKKGIWSPELGTKLWMYYVEKAAKAYAKEFATMSEWSKMFTRATREHVAKRYAREEHAMIQRGEYMKYPPVKAAERDRGRSSHRGRATSARDSVTYADNLAYARKRADETKKTYLVHGWLGEDGKRHAKVVVDSPNNRRMIKSLDETIFKIYRPARR